MTQSAQLNANVSPDENNNIAPELPWIVYAIAVDGDADNPFYIGITQDTDRRAREHNNRDSACYDLSRAYDAQGIECYLTPVARFATKEQALACESLLIALRTRLVNRDVTNHVRSTLYRYGEFSA